MHITTNRPCELVALSAGTAAELTTVARALADDLATRPAAPLAAVARAQALVQRDGPYRVALLARDTTEAVRLLRRVAPAAERATVGPPVTFLFPGVGDHHAGMAAELYRCEPVFRHWLDRCAELLLGELGVDIRSVLYPDGGVPARARARIDLAELIDPGDRDESEINRTLVAQPLVFAVEYALARLLRGWGVEPAAMAGYSIGEYVAATIAGVLSLEDALTLVARRAELIETGPPGAMLVVMLGRRELGELLGDELSLAAVDGPTMCVAAGPVHAVELLRKRLTEDGVASLRVPTRHAFHSAMMVPIRDRLADLVATFELRAPTTPFLSNTSGTWISADEATDSGYWAGHLHRTVRFHDNLTEVWRRPGTLAVEVGVGQMLTGFAAQHPECPRGARPRVFAALPGALAGQGDVAAVLTVLGRLWEAGVPVDWPELWPKEEW